MNIPETFSCHISTFDTGAKIFLDDQTQNFDLSAIRNLKMFQVIISLHEVF